MKPSLLSYNTSHFMILSGLIWTLFSCTNVLDNKYSRNTAEGDLERIKALSNLKPEEYQTLTNYMLKKGLISPDLLYTDNTYEEIYNEATNDKKNMDLLKKHEEKRKSTNDQFVNDHMEHLHDKLEMIPELSEIRKDWSNKYAFFYKMTFFNPGDKTIRAFRGKFSFLDAFNNELKTIQLIYSDTIAAKDTVYYTANIDFTNISNNTLYVTKDYKDLKVLWQPSIILYVDGTTAE